MQRRDLFRCRPTFRRGQTITPGQSSVTAPFVNDGATTVPLRVDAQHRLAVFQQACGRMSEILSGLTINNDLAFHLVVQIDQ